MERSWASSTMRNSVPYWCRCPMSFGLRVRQCPLSESPKALKNWSPSACSSSMFFGATTARTDRPPALFCRSRMAVVLPAPGSATSKCQERLSQESCSFAWRRLAKAVSMNGYVLKGERVMSAAPLTSYEPVKYGLDGYHQHLGVLVEALVGQVSWPQESPSVQKRWQDECRRVGDPIDEPVHLRESRCCGDDVRLWLRLEYEHERAILGRSRDAAAPRRVCASLWLPTRSLCPPSAQGNRLPQHIPPRQKYTEHPRPSCHNTGQTHGHGVVRGVPDTHTIGPGMRVCCRFARDTHDGASCDFAPSAAAV